MDDWENLPTWSVRHDRMLKFIKTSPEFKDTDFGKLSDERLRHELSFHTKDDLRLLVWHMKQSKKDAAKAEEDHDIKEELFISTGEGWHCEQGKVWQQKYPAGTWFNFKDYSDITESETFGRLKHIDQLGQIGAIYDGPRGYSRFSHSLTVLYWATEFANILSLNEHDRRLTELFGLDHDLGHILWGHTAENYLNQISHFSHEDHGIEKLQKIKRQIEKHGITIDELIEMFRETNPLSELIAGQLGADRFAYINHDIDKVMGGITHMNFMPYRNFPKMHKIAQSFQFVEARHLPKGSRFPQGRYLAHTDAMQEIIKLIDQRAFSYAHFYFNRNVEIAEVLASKVLYELGFRTPESLKDHTDTTIRHKILTTKGKKRIVGAYKRLERGYVHPFAASLKFPEGMEVIDNQDMSDGIIFVFHPNEHPCYSEQITEEIEQELREKFGTWEATRRLEDKLMKQFGLKRMEVAVCNYIQRKVTTKPVDVWDGKKIINVYDEVSFMREMHQRWMKENYGFRIAVAEQHHAKVQEYFSRKKNLLKLVMDAV